MDQTTNAVQELSKQDKPEDIWAKQTEFLKQAYEHGLANLRELTELSTKANAAAADLLTHRVTDTLEEIRGAYKPANGASSTAAQ